MSICQMCAYSISAVSPSAAVGYSKGQERYYVLFWSYYLIANCLKVIKSHNTTVPPLHFYLVLCSNFLQTQRYTLELVCVKA